ncbi:MAG: L-threonylcarbamoyladenylate synthase [bacterium]
MQNDWQKAINILKKGGVAVIPTDTIYGIVGSALSKNAVDKVYEIKGRDNTKSCIILINSDKDLIKFGFSLPQFEFWPGKVSVVVSCVGALYQKLKYLHHGAGTVAFRMVGPRNKNLFNLINKVGPIIAPSANPQGLAPALNITEAKKYFCDKVDVYVNGRTKVSKPSTLVEWKDGKIKVLRQGAVAIK